MNFDHFITQVRRDYGYAGQVVHVETLPAQDALFADDDCALHPAIADALTQQGIDRLYTHQAEAMSALRRGEHIVVVTATASGKTLCYQIPTLEALLDDPHGTALYLFPTKALAQDQARGLARFGDLNAQLKFAMGTYDGDTLSNLRKTLREEGRVILSNPDMVHGGVCPIIRGGRAFFSTCASWSWMKSTRIAGCLARMSPMCCAA